MIRVGVPLVAALLLATGAEAAATAKSGEPFLPPPLPSERALAALGGGDLLVQVRDAPAREAATILRAGGARRVSRALDVWLVPAGGAAATVAKLRSAGVLRAVEPNERNVATAALIQSASDPLLPQQWWVGHVGIDQVEPPGPGRPVAVIDSGIDTGHPEFAGRPDTALLNDQALEGEDDAHGSAVASVVGAPANGLGVVGIYPQAALQAFDAGSLTIAEVVTGVEAAAAAGPGVINMSYGSADYSFIEEQALLVAFGTGSILVAAVGNEFDAGNPLEYPASYNHVLTIAATDPDRRPTYFSNANIAVDLAAPGTRIPVAIPAGLDTTDGNPDGFTSFDGTSFAAPLVAGATAWVWTTRPELDNTQVFDLMRFSARDVWDAGYDDDTGFGLVDVGAALAREAPTRDLQEPNDDVDHVVRGGLFARGARPLTDPGRRRAALSARLDVTEDPEDVYRVWVGPKKRVTITVSPTRNVDVEVWAPDTPSVFLTGKKRRRYLIDGSYGKGRKQETLVVVNEGSRGDFVFLDVFLPRNGPLDAGYEATIETARLPAGR